MPLEIKELVIRAQVVAEPQPRDAGPGHDRLPHGRRPEAATAPADIERIVETCVRRALRTLKRSQER